MDEQELATVLAALRYWQTALMQGIVDLSVDGESLSALAEIATDCRRLEPLDDIEVAKLCKKINTGEVNVLSPEEVNHYDGLVEFVRSCTRDGINNILYRLRGLESWVERRDHDVPERMNQLEEQVRDLERRVRAVLVLPTD